MTEAQRALLSKARSSREEVVLLIENGYLETAVARAYYGMFYLAQALLLEKDITPSSHKHMIVAFGREFSKEEVAFRVRERQGQRGELGSPICDGVESLNAFLIALSLVPQMLTADGVGFAIYGTASLIGHAVEGV